jgi:hypothetical protein
MGTTTTTQNINNKEIFKNNEITVIGNVSQQSESVFTGNLFVTNNLDKVLTGVKLNLLVPKYVIPKVVSSNNTQLEPKEQLGMRKEFVMTSSDTSKPIKIQIKYSYCIGDDQNEVTLY